MRRRSCKLSICRVRHRGLTVNGSKQLQFGMLNAQNVVKLSEFQVTHRDLYTPTDRQPVKDGVLDRRLVRRKTLFTRRVLTQTIVVTTGDIGEKCVLRDVWPQLC